VTQTGPVTVDVVATRPKWKQALTPTPIHRHDLQRLLGRLAAFAGCNRRVLGPLVRWGDLVRVEAGEILAREDHGDFWFFVVLTGSVTLKRRGRRIATLGPGSHFGEVAIVGLRPQHATITTAQPSVLFVLGPRYLLSLIASSTRLRHNLFPDVDPTDFVAYTRRMRQQADQEWRAVPWAQRPVPTSAPPWTRVPPDTPANRPPGRTLSLSDAVAIIGQLPPRLDDAPSTGVAAPRMPRWLRVSVAGLAVVLAGVALLAYHPPIAVVSAGQPIDVVQDITISGLPSHRPTGRYLLLWVRDTRPNLLGTFVALAHGDTTISTERSGGTPADAAESQRVGRHQYLDSQLVAIGDVGATLGMKNVVPSVHIRDRGFVGPSAGLIYALALSDMLGARDLSGGRTIAATGGIEPDGRVDPVGWVSVKTLGATDSGATVLFVPRGQEPEATASKTPVYGVASLSQAIDDLGHGR
jgi:PDZ domain-containing protein